MGRVINDIPLIGWLLNQIVDNGATTDAVCTGNEGNFAGQGPNAVDAVHGDREFVGCEKQQNLRRVYYELYSPLAPYPDLWACQQYTDILLYNIESSTSPTKPWQSVAKLQHAGAKHQGSANVMEAGGSWRGTETSGSRSCSISIPLTTQRLPPFSSLQLDLFSHPLHPGSPQVT